MKNNSYICNVENLKTIILLCLLLPIKYSTPSVAKMRVDTTTLKRVMAYSQGVAEQVDGIHTNVYLRYFFNTERRNFTLMAIPSMYAISRGHREYAGETFSTIYIKDNNITEAVRHLNTGTIPHHRTAMTVLLKYLMPNIYGITMLDNQLLSPFNATNTKLYKYDITNLTDGRAEIIFRPKRYNTQLISGAAIVDRRTGRVISMRFGGEYDMVRFRTSMVMGEKGVRSLLPKTCDVEATFRFLGNKIKAFYHSVYDNPMVISDTLVNSHDMRLMQKVRPDSLPEKMKSAYLQHAQRTFETADNTKAKKEEKQWENALWDIVGDYLINRTKGTFGTKGQGAFRISPILNPLYLSYSKRKGITYKTKLNLNYNFSLNQEVSLGFNAGYSFKQGQLYFRMPLKYSFDKRKNGFAEIEIGNGNRITNSTIVDQLKHENVDSIDWGKMNLDYFKDFYIKAAVNYDLSDKWSIQPGLRLHRRSAIDKKGFNTANRPTTYYSFAPSLELQLRPIGWKGPIITLDYERGIKAGNAEMEYERIEADLSWKKQYHSLQSLSTRIGGGFYTAKNDKSYFLDYKNFRENNIPGGWNDDWTGEFQLLNSNWYNASEYYVRANVTYESPLMILSRIPYLGRLMEMERIYANMLFVEHLHPYMEYGYGFTNRFFSMGIFAATRNWKFDGVGFRFGFELFRDW